MRIVYLAHAAIPARTANSVNIMKMCAAFRRNGHDVRLVAPCRPGRAQDVQDVFHFYGIAETFPIEWLPWGTYPGRSYVYAVHAALRIRRAAPDIVYTRFLTGAVASTLTGMRTVFEAHVPPRDQGRWAGGLLRLVAKRNNLTRVVAISGALRDDFVTHYPALESRLLVAHDGADLPAPAGRCASLNNSRSSAIQVGYVGQLYRGKGVEIILQLAAACPWAQFHVVGGAPTDVAYWTQVAQGATNLHFYGFVPPSEVDGYLRAFDVVLAPYQRRVAVFGGSGDVAQWMSPLKLFEYMAAEKAIICSDLPVLREVLEHESTALLCDPESPQAWCAALSRLRDDPELRSGLARRARMVCERQYTWTVRAHRVLNDLPGRQ